MEDWPELKQEASINDARNIVHTGIVQAFQHGNILIRITSAPTQPIDGSVLELTWGTQGGVKKLPVRYVTGMEAAGITMWALEPAGPGTKQQRREYVRIEMGTPLEIKPSGSSKLIECILVDISEVALRGQVSTDFAWLVPSGTQVGVIFMLGTVKFSLVARVSRQIPNPSGRTVDFVAAFEQNEQDRSMLRRSVFAEQVRQRNLLADIRS